MAHGGSRPLLSRGRRDMRRSALWLTIAMLLFPSTAAAVSGVNTGGAVGKDDVGVGISVTSPGAPTGSTDSGKTPLISYAINYEYKGDRPANTGDVGGWCAVDAQH